MNSKAFHAADKVLNVIHKMKVINMVTFIIYSKFAGKTYFINYSKFTDIITAIIYSKFAGKTYFINYSKMLMNNRQFIFKICWDSFNFIMNLRNFHFEKAFNSKFNTFSKMLRLYFQY